MSDRFRKSPEHAQDINNIIEFLKMKNLDRFYPVGTNRRTISIVYLATVLKYDTLTGVVLVQRLALRLWEAADLKRRLKGSPVLLLSRSEAVLRRKIISFFPKGAAGNM